MPKDSTPVIKRILGLLMVFISYIFRTVIVPH